jgi:16S rRNA U516 pseudouridylate synthase RsuA-like enzyme
MKSTKEKIKKSDVKSSFCNNPTKMKLLTYLQTTHHLSRRNIIAFIQQGKILVNGEKVESFKHELIPNDRIILPN